MSSFESRPLGNGSSARPRRHGGQSGEPPLVRLSAAHDHCVLVRSARHFGVGMFSLRLQREHTEEVHMKIQSMNVEKPMLCATVATDIRALLG